MDALALRAAPHGHSDGLSYGQHAAPKEGYRQVAQSPGDEPRSADDQSTHDFRLERSAEIGGQLPLDVLPPEVIERLRAGGDLTPEEMAMLRSPALADSGPMGRLIDAAITSGLLRETGRDQPGEAVGLAGDVRTYEWKWQKPADQTSPPVSEPATYYELLSAREDPNRDFFLTARRMLNHVAWAAALGVPLLLVGLGMASGQSSETIFFVGVFGLIIGVMIRKSVPGPFFG